MKHRHARNHVINNRISEIGRNTERSTFKFRFLRRVSASTSSMELSGTVLRQVTTYPSRGGVSVGPRRRVMMGSSGFCDEGHLKYYSPIRCGGKDKGPTVLTVKKKLKMLKGFSKDLSLFSQLGFDLDPALFNDLQGNLTSDAAELLMKQLEQARAEEKEMKKKMKQEKKEKAKLKAAKMKTVPDCESSSSSSESSDSECDKVVDMDRLRARVAVAPVDEVQPTMLSPLPLLPHTTVVENPQEDATSHYNHHAMELCSRNDICVSSPRASFKNKSTTFATAPQKRIEVCMGNKCKKSGAAALLQQFEKVVGAEGGAVVGCKCMGKCKTAPNVRVQNAVDDSLAKGLNDSVQIPPNPLCIGVGLEDVDAIVARFFGENQEDMDMAAATTC